MAKLTTSSQCCMPSKHFWCIFCHRSSPNIQPSNAAKTNHSVYNIKSLCKNIYITESQNGRRRPDHRTSFFLSSESITKSFVEKLQFIRDAFISILFQFFDTEPPNFTNSGSSTGVSGGNCILSFSSSTLMVALLWLTVQPVPTEVATIVGTIVIIDGLTERCQGWRAAQ